MASGVSCAPRRIETGNPPSEPQSQFGATLWLGHCGRWSARDLTHYKPVGTRPSVLELILIRTRRALPSLLKPHALRRGPVARRDHAIRTLVIRKSHDEYKSELIDSQRVLQTNPISSRRIRGLEIYFLPAGIEFIDENGSGPGVRDRKPTKGMLPPVCSELATPMMFRFADPRF